MTEPQALVATYGFDSGEENGPPYSATVRFTGRRVGARGARAAGETFTREETIEGIVPGTGPVTITTTVHGVDAGEWTVSAELVRTWSAEGELGRPRDLRAREVRPVDWSWRRWAVTPGPGTPIRTRWALLAPLARQPAVMPGVYTALALLGIALTLALQAVILAGRNVPVGPALTASVLGTLAGLAGAKAWYAVLHPDESLVRGGWAVDGFLVVAPVVAAIALYASRVPIGVALDATAPGIGLAIALGRVGCFVTGCCAGRCTASRWGVWSSDRRVGARRVPTQLLEAGVGLLLGLAALVLVLVDVMPVGGVVFVGMFAIYGASRQVLLRLRVERRRSMRTVPATAAATAVALVVVAALSATQGV